MAKSIRAKSAAVIAAIRMKTALAISVMTTLIMPAVASAAGAANSYSYTATQPPDTGKISTVLDYLFWGVGLAGVVGLLTIGALLAVAHHSGRGGGEHVSKIGYVCSGMVLAGAAGSVVTALM
jgi:hypothetical protein